MSSRLLTVTFVVCSLMTIILMGFSDKLPTQKTALCKSAKSGLIDSCAKSGGLN
jgi:hypothetical protein